VDSIIGWNNDFINGIDDDEDIGALISGDDEDIGALISGDDAKIVGALISAGYSNEEIGRKMHRRKLKKQAKKQAAIAQRAGGSTVIDYDKIVAEVMRRTQAMNTGTNQAKTVGQSLLPSNQMRITMPLGETVSTAAGGTWSLAITLQKPFQPYVLILDAVFVTSNLDAAGVCRVSRIDIGVDNMLAAIGVAPMAAFNSRALNNQITYRAASQGATITVAGTVSTVAAQNVIVSGTMYGVGAAN